MAPDPRGAEAEQVGHLGGHQDRHARGAEVLRHRVDQLTESALRRHAERYAREAIEHDAPSVHALHPLPSVVEKAIRREFDGRRVVEEEALLPLQLRQVPAEPFPDPPQLFRGLLQREKNARLPGPGARQQEVQPEERLPDARAALDHGRAAAREATAKERVEPAHPGGGCLACRRRPRARLVRGPNARVNRDAPSVDVEEVLTAHVGRPAQLQDLDLAYLRQLGRHGSELNDAVRDAKLRQPPDLVAAVLTDEERRRLPARESHGQVVENRPRRSVVRCEVVEHFCAVDGHQIGLLVLNVLLHLRRRRRHALRAEGRAEVPDDDAVPEQRRVEEVETLDEPHEFERRLGERRAVQTPPSLARQMEHHLKRENGLAGAWVARDHRDRAPGEPATKDLIEGGAAAAHSVRQFTPALHPRFDASTNETPLSRKRGSRSSRSTTTDPVNRVRSTPSSLAKARSTRKASGSAARRQLSGTSYSYVTVLRVTLTIGDAGASAATRFVARRTSVAVAAVPNSSARLSHSKSNSSAAVG